MDQATIDIGIKMLVISLGFNLAFITTVREYEKEVLGLKREIKKMKEEMDDLKKNGVTYFKRYK